MKKFTRVDLSLVLIFVMAISMIGCSGSNNTQGSASTNTSTENNSEASSSYPK